MSESVIVSALRPVAQALETLGVEYHIGGSLASSYHGPPRSTVDIDIVAYLRLEHVPKLVAMLSGEYYADADMMKEAIRDRHSFNLIHHATSFKIDVFVPAGRPFDQSARSRVVRGRPFQHAEEEYPIASAEDTILNKLEWYRQGGETSERQWRDVAGVMKMQAEALDRAYLRKWAAQLEVHDLLERAWGEAGLA